MQYLDNYLTDAIAGLGSSGNCNFIFGSILGLSHITVDTGFDPKFITCGLSSSSTRYAVTEINSEYNTPLKCYGIPTNKDNLTAIHIESVTFYSSSVLIYNQQSTKLYYLILG